MLFGKRLTGSELMLTNNETDIKLTRSLENRDILLKGTTKKL